MEKITYYFIEETPVNENHISILGKGKKHMFYCDWWDIKEYGFLEKSKANAVAKRYNRTKKYANYRVVKKIITFDNREDKIYFIDRFIRPYEKQKVVDMVLEEGGNE